jgi:hypothetical protein
MEFKQNSRFLLSVGVLFFSSLAIGDTPTRRPVVVELFESQGCSSCPPAEEAIVALQKQFGSAIIPLVFHVDYWDHPWKDTFSDVRNTQRQSDYSRTFGDSSIYTPEMVVQGDVGFVGSDYSRAREEIQQRLSQTRLALSLIYEVSPTRAGDGNVHILLPPDLNRQARQVTLVIFENAAPVHVQRGENAGATMSGNFAVRKFWTIPTVDSGRYDVPLHLVSDWNPYQTSVAVLVQGNSSLILAAEAAPLGAS